MEALGARRKVWVLACCMGCAMVCILFVLCAKRQVDFCGLCGRKRWCVRVLGVAVQRGQDPTSVSEVIEPLLPGGHCEHEWHRWSVEPAIDRPWERGGHWPSSINPSIGDLLARTAMSDKELAVATARVLLTADLERQEQTCAEELLFALAGAGFSGQGFLPVKKDWQEARRLAGLGPLPDASTDSTGE